jgi:N-acetylmuramoyl-L-alanine amidase
MLQAMRMPQRSQRTFLSLALLAALLATGAADAASGQPADAASRPQRGADSGTSGDAAPGPSPARSLQLAVSRTYLARGREGARVRATVELTTPVDVRLRVTDFDGRTVRQLFRGRHEAGTLERAWDGRDDEGQLLPAGPYRIVASTRPDGTTTVDSEEAWITLAERRPYPIRPGFITVALDPGHGGTADGAVGRDGTREADINLDTALRLARMLEGAGVGVVLTRTSDVDVNDPPNDLTGDGVIDETDELAARPDIANLARADLYIAIHNNTAVQRSVGGPSTYVVETRPFGPRSVLLAEAIQSALMRALQRLRSGAWRPYDHGVLSYPYYVLRGYDPPRLVRPTQMPGVLSEGLFLSNRQELRLLKQPRVRTAMASAYYDAVAGYLAGRDSHVGYRLLSSPAEAAAGERTSIHVEVRNQGHLPLRGWKLLVSAVPAPERYVGRPDRGRILGQRRLPTLRPGQKAELAIRVTAPAPAGEWMLIVDAQGEGERASRLGSPPLQVRLTTVGGGRLAEEPASASPRPSA